MKVLAYGDVCVRWDIDQTHSVVMQDDLKLEINLPGDVAELQTSVNFVVPKPWGISYTDYVYIMWTNKQWKITFSKCEKNSNKLYCARKGSSSEL